MCVCKAVCLCEKDAENRDQGNRKDQYFYLQTSPSLRNLVAEATGLLGDDCAKLREGEVGLEAGGRRGGR